jgi:hypothetical protein
MLLFKIILIKIIPLYLAVCTLAYIYRKVGHLLFPKIIYKDYYSTLYNALREANKFSKTKHKLFNTVSSYLLWLRNNQETQSLFTNGVAGQVCNKEEERQTELLKFNSLLLCAFVPVFTPIKSVWLFCQVCNNSFNRYNVFHSLTFMKKSEIILFLKNL